MQMPVTDMQSEMITDGSSGLLGTFCMMFIPHAGKRIHISIPMYFLFT